MEEGAPAGHPARILVSSSRKPISYINLCKRFLQEHGEVQLSALGIAIAPMVTLAEILKSRGLAIEKSLATSFENLSDNDRSRQKPKMEVVLTKAAGFDQILSNEAESARTVVDGYADGYTDGPGQSEEEEELPGTEDQLPDVDLPAVEGLTVEEQSAQGGKSQ